MFLSIGMAASSFVQLSEALREPMRRLPIARAT
jgi:hypothetical protein